MFLKRIIQIILIICSGVLIQSCQTSSKNDIARSDIKDVLYDITVGFNQHDVNRIMRNVHQEYKHNGIMYYSLRELWLDRMTEYQLLEITGIAVQLNDDYAIASFNMTLTGNNGSVSSNEPIEHGDCSYFYYTGEKWVLCGNEFNP